MTSNQAFESESMIGINVLPGQKIQFQVNYNEVRPIQLQKCSNIRGSLMEDCMDRYLTDLMMNDKGCTWPWIQNNSIICSNSNGLDVSSSKSSLIKDSICNANISCNSLIHPTISSRNILKSASPDYGDNSFYFPSRILVSTEYHIYPFLSFVAEVGGYFTVLLGFSVMDLVTYGYLYSKSNK